MKGQRTTLYYIYNILLSVILFSNPLFAQEDVPEQPQLHSPENKTFIQINNILIQGDKVCLKLSHNTYANIGKLLILDSAASIFDSSAPSSLAKSTPAIDDVVVLTRYIPNEEVVRATVAMSSPQIEVDTSIVEDDNITTEDIFGSRGGYLHPYVSYHGEYTDNVYNINIDEKTNYLSILSPGIWLAIPRINEVPLSLSPHNAAVGGLRYSAVGSGAFNRFQTFLLAGMDYKMYSEDSELNYTTWRIGGMYQQNLPAGISIRAADRYTRDRDRFDQGSFLPTDFTVEQDKTSLSSTPSLIRDFSSNLALLSINIDMSERFSGHFDYSNFWLDYDEQDDSWLDRMDNQLSVSVSYNHSPKTSVFFQYNHTILSYQSDESNDSENTFAGGGVRWKSSAKTSLMVKGGYQNREYTAIDEESQGVFSMEGNLDYLITDKTKVGFKIYKAMEETDSIQNRGKDTIAFQLRYDQRFSYRLQGHVEFRHETNDYDGFQRAEYSVPNQEPRKDYRFMVRPGVQYFFSDWLMTELAYAYENRNSTDNIYDFMSQSVFLSLNAAF